VRSSRRKPLLRDLLHMRCEQAIKKSSNTSSGAGHALDVAAYPYGQDEVLDNLHSGDRAEAPALDAAA
jgi:hypothetical protein